MEFVAKPVKELFLDTKGTCFLCVKNVNSDSGERKKDVCLRSVCRYLDINPGSVLRRGLEGSVEAGTGDNKNDPEVKCEFSMAMCLECAVIVEKLEDLKRQQEIINMLMEYHVKRLDEILENLGNDGISDKMASDPVEARLLSLLRNETKRKCVLKLRKIQAASLPKIEIDRMVNCNEVSNSDDENTCVDASVSGESQSLQGLLPAEGLDTFGILKRKFNRTNENKRKKCPFCPPTSLEVNFGTKRTQGKFKKKVTEGQNKSPKFWICNFKNGGCGQKFTRKFSLNKHNQNTEKFTKEWSCSELLEDGRECNSKFGSWCALQRHRVESGHGVSHNKRGWLCCVSSGGCGQKFTNKQRLFKHKNNKCSKTKLLTRNSRLTRMDPSTVWLCDYDQGGCGQKFSRQESLRKHKFGSTVFTKEWTCAGVTAGGDCELKFRSKCNLTRHEMETGHGDYRKMRRVNGWTCHLSSGGCGRKFALKHGLDRHKQNNCPNRKTVFGLSRQKQLHRRRQLTKLWKMKVCEACGDKRFRSMEALQAHFKQVHQSDVVPKVETFTSDDNMDGRIGNSIENLDAFLINYSQPIDCTSEQDDATIVNPKEEMVNCEFLTAVEVEIAELDDTQNVNV